MRQWLKYKVLTEAKCVFTHLLIKWAWKAALPSVTQSADLPANTHGVQQHPAPRWPEQRTRDEQLLSMPLPFTSVSRCSFCFKDCSSVQPFTKGPAASTLTSICHPPFLHSAPVTVDPVAEALAVQRWTRHHPCSQAAHRLERKTDMETGMFLSQSWRKPCGAKRAKRNKKWNKTKPENV